MRIWILFFCWFVFLGCSIAQLKGRLTDQEGNPLAFASIYIKNTTKGSISNKDGSYVLELPVGKNRIVFHYLGYQVEEREVEYHAQVIVLDVALKPSAYNLGEIVISSDQEDPAYPIIRKAIAKRNAYFNGKADFACNAYTKGSIKILDIPKKILGKEIGNLDGNLDSNRKGIIYLSETVSKLSFNKPDHFYEEMISSRISGRDNGFSFNRASSVLFNLYENTNEFGRAIVSPIADFALDYYKYSLLSTDTIASDSLILHRIRITPKNNSLPAWSGVITIQEGSWNLYELNLHISGKQVQQELFDSIYLSQVFIPVEGFERYELQSQVFGFKAALFVIKLEGKFAVVFSDYNFNSISKQQDNRVLLRIQEGANTKVVPYWDSIRPVPLTAEEITDYRSKDSLKIIRDSKVYKDSVDQLKNQFKTINFLTGYTYHNSYNKRSFGISSPLEIIHFNPVQGWSLGTKIRFSQQQHAKNEYKEYSIESKLEYGFSENIFRPTLRYTQRFNEFRKSELNVKIGIDLETFDHNPGSLLVHEISNLWLKKNYNKYYENRVFGLNYKQYLSYDFLWFGEWNYNIRSILNNHSNYSIAKKDRLYSPNSVSENFNDSLFIQQSDYMSFTNRIRWRPGTKVWLAPNATEYLESDWPVIRISHTWGFYPKSKQQFHVIGTSLYNEQSLQSWGHLSYLVKATKIVHKEPIDPSEWIFQKGNPFVVYNKPNDPDVFLSLEPYAHSTDNQMVSWFMEWDLQGKLLDRIPLINKLGLKELIRYSSVVNDRNKPYAEYSIGFGNIGYKVFRIFRFDWVHSFEGSSYFGSNFRLALLSNIGGGK
ncbi:MAG: carboxypeptidase-like regulatory domain-containing protein [Saprospiraceae bacterium]|nr:carboxypeptidase-like regulatory domain-containing protein [Saprospiraceae bacterium]